MHELNTVTQALKTKLLSFHKETMSDMPTNFPMWWQIRTPPYPCPVAEGDENGTRHHGPLVIEGHKYKEVVLQTRFAKILVLPDPKK
jgi:hypothetical protein